MHLQEEYISPALKASRQDLDRAMRHAFSVTAFMIAACLCAYLIVISTVLPGFSPAKLFGCAAAVLFAGIGYWGRKARALRLPVAAFSALATILVLAAMATNGGVTSYIAPLLIMSCLISGFFLDIRASLATAALVSLCVIGFYVFQVFGFVAPSAFDPERLEVAAVIVLCVTAFLCALSVGTLTSHLDVFSSRLATSRAQLESLVENAPVALAMFDERLRYIRCSADWLEDHDLVGQDVVGNAHYDLIPGSEDHWRETHLRCLGGATESSDGEVFKAPDGEEKIIAWEITPWRDHTGDIAGLLMITRDITQQRRLKDKLIQAYDVAEKAYSEKAALLEELGHEIREPLNALSGVLDLLARTELNAAQAKMLESLQKSGVSMMAIVDRLLQVTQVEPDEEAAVLEPFDVKEVVASVIKSLSAEADVRNFGLNTRISVANHRYIGARSSLERLLRHLTTQALHHIGSGNARIAVREGVAGRLVFEITAAQAAENGSELSVSGTYEADQSLVDNLTRGLGGSLEIIDTDASQYSATLDIPAVPQSAMPDDDTDRLPDLRYG